LLQHFLSEWQDLIDWCKLMEARLTADELASDLASAEALVDKHQEHMVRFFGKLNFTKIRIELTFKYYGKYFNEIIETFKFMLIN